MSLLGIRFVTFQQPFEKITMSIKLCDLSLTQLLDMQGERFCDAVLGEHPDEHDSQYLNHLSRHVVWAIEREKGAAFLGVLSPLYAEMPLFRPWEGERIDAFSAAFCTPTLDEELIRLVEDYREHVADLDPGRLFAIYDRLEEVGGVMLHWLGGDPEQPGDGDDNPDGEPKYDLGEAW
jgi:hypothetical protein